MRDEPSVLTISVASSAHGPVRSQLGRVTDPRSMASTNPRASAPGLLLDWRPPTPIKKHMIPKVVDAASAVDLFRKSDSKTSLLSIRDGTSIWSISNYAKTPAKNSRVRMNANPGITVSQPFGPQFDPTVHSLMR